jgi:hypothetical protein
MSSSEFERRRSLRPKDLEALPEYVLWTLRKEGNRAEARVRLIPTVGPELRIYVTGEAAIDTARDLVWSKVIIHDGAALIEESDQKLKEFTERGWVEDPDSQARRADGSAGPWSTL